MQLTKNNLVKNLNHRVLCAVLSKYERNISVYRPIVQLRDNKCCDGIVGTKVNAYIYSCYKNDEPIYSL
jgi:hypothetical protein